ncbi:hypothetical protein CHS0354_039959, partial [Potamilus streckersoni]
LKTSTIRLDKKDPTYMGYNEIFHRMRRSYDEIKQEQSLPQQKRAELPTPAQKQMAHMRRQTEGRYPDKPLSFASQQQ